MNNLHSRYSTSFTLFGANSITLAIFFGLAVRGFLIFGFEPETYSIWFVPFLSHLVEGNWIDPWSSFLGAGGRTDAFPYGPVYVLVYGTVAELSSFIGNDSAISIGLRLIVFVLELCLIRTVGELAEKADKRLVLAIMWLNPISMYVCYWHGQLDILPVLLLTVSFLSLRKERPVLAGLLFGLAVAAKSAMLIAAPFVLAMCVRDKRFRSILPDVILGAIITLCLIVPLLFSSGFQQMVLATPETNKLLALTIAMPGDARIFVVPLVLLGLLVFTWRIARYTWFSVFALVGASFLTLYILTPASPGWALWVAPFIPILLTKFSALTRLVSLVFLFAAALRHLVSATGAHPIFSGWKPPVEGWLYFQPQHELLYSFLVTAVTATGAATLLQIIRVGVLQDKFYKATRAPVSILVSGDSGAGKDTLVSNFAKVAGENRVCHISGDDYHIWDRHKPMWRALTHLNPKANHLDRFFGDAQTLVDGGVVRKRHYDHAIGRMTRPEKLVSREFVVASGLHALLNPTLNRHVDLCVHLNMDESLRNELKIRRDTTERGHSIEKALASIDKREPDSERFIRPQIENADISFQLLARSERDLTDFYLGEEPDTSFSIPMKLRIGLRTDEDFPVLERMMLGAVNAKVMPVPSSDGWHFLDVECDSSGDTIAFAATRFMPELFDLLSTQPDWPGGLNGVMQLVLLHCIGRKRRILHFDSELP